MKYMIFLIFNVFNKYIFSNCSYLPYTGMSFAQHPLKSASIRSISCKKTIDYFRKQCYNIVICNIIECISKEAGA